MSDPTALSAADSSSASLPIGGEIRTVGGREFRFDGPHTPASVSTAAPTPAARPVRREAQLLLEASQMVVQLQQEIAEQERREELIAHREQRLSDERRELEAWADSTRGELEERRQSLLMNEASLATRMRELDDTARELDAESESLQRERSQLAAERLALRNELQEEMASERRSIESLRAEVEAIAQQALLDREIAAQRAAEELEQERQKLWAALTEEWQQKNSVYESVQAAWHEQQSREQAELAVLRDRYVAALDALDIQLLNRRSAFEAELTALRESTYAELANARSEWENERATVDEQAQKERQQQESRLRFQQEHLEKTRTELEAAQLEFRAERQKERQQLEDDARQLERRVEQVRQYQSVLDLQAESLDRERQALGECRLAWDSSADADRDSLQADRESWEEQRRQQAIELQRQQQVLAQQTESLERKQARLEQLRRELEDTHRATLELRLAVEESWSQIADIAGSEESARQRVDDARQGLVVYYQKLHHGLTEQRQELLNQQAELDRRRAEFHDERQTLTQWIAERDHLLQVEEDRLRHELSEVAARDIAWRTARDRWLSEKLLAENVIRRMLSELSQPTLQALDLTEFAAASESLSAAEEVNREMLADHGLPDPSPRSTGVLPEAA